jgi:hypothetical protein
MQVYEAYNSEQVVQFPLNQQQEANDFAAANNMQVRLVTQTDDFPDSQPVVDSGKSIDTELFSGKGIVIQDDIDNKGLVAKSDFSSNYENKSYVQKAWVDNTMLTSQITELSAGVTHTLTEIMGTVHIIGSGATTIELPLFSVTIPYGKWYRIKNRSNANVTVQSTSANVENGANIILSSGDSALFQLGNDNNYWLI